MKKTLSRITAFLAIFVMASVHDVSGKVSMTEDALNLDGYKVMHYYDFHAMTADGNAIGDIQTEASGIKISGKEVSQFKTDGITNWYAWYTASTNDGLRFRDGYGLYNWGNGDRGCAIGNLRAGHIVAFEVKDGGKGARLVIYTGNSNNAVDVTDSIHKLQVDNGGVADNFRYFEMKENGRLDMLLGRKASIAAAAILGDADAPEYVDAPLVKLEAVYYAERQLAITPGTSSYGNETETYYSTDGSVPVYGDSIWVPSEENPDSLVFSEFKLKPMELEDGTLVYGDYMYDNSGNITIGDYDLVEGDTTGMVTIKLVSLTKSGVVSSMTVESFDVSDITLNTPRLALVGIDDVYRDYKVEWDNNTLCNEDYNLTVETESETFENVAVGDVFRTHDHIKAIVQVDGYRDGVCDIQELEQEGKVYYRKNAEALHDWDFLNLTDDQIKGIKGEIVDYGYMIDENGDTIIIPADDVINNPPAEDFTIVYKNMGWGTFDSKNSRSARRFVTDTIIKPVYDEDGVTIIRNDTTTETRYAEDLSGMFHDGLEFGGTSGMFIYLPKGAQKTSELGLYLMGKTTVYVPNVQYGEFVVFNLGKGGTNYITSKYSACEFVESTDGVHSKLLDKEFIQSIDVYTADELPDNIEDIYDGTGYDSVYVNVYSIDGRLVKARVHKSSALNGLDRGIYIMGGKKYIVR